MSALDAAKRADQLKEDANRSLHEDRPQEALSLYTKAIGIQPSAVLYANRAAAQMRIGRLQKAIEDANEALKLDKTYAKAYYRKARALCDDKQYDAADRCLDEAFQNLPPNDDYRREKEREALEKLRDLVEQKRDEARGAPTAKHFEFLGELGTGNYSSVYEVARKSDAQRFALKLVEKAQVDKIKRRHPNVHNEVKMEKVRCRRPFTPSTRLVSVERGRFHAGRPQATVRRPAPEYYSLTRDLPGLRYIILLTRIMSRRRDVVADFECRWVESWHTRTLLVSAVLGRGTCGCGGALPRAQLGPPRPQTREPHARRARPRQAHRLRDVQGPRR